MERRPVAAGKSAVVVSQAAAVVSAAAVAGAGVGVAGVAQVWDRPAVERVAAAASVLLSSVYRRAFDWALLGSNR